MILPIYIYGQPVLRKVAEDITPDYPELKELINNMYETLDSSNGIGLAAPQIGLAIRLVVIDLDVLSEDLPEYKGFRHVFINPHILEYDEEAEKMNGYLVTWRASCSMSSTIWRAPCSWIVFLLFVRT